MAEYRKMFPSINFFNFHLGFFIISNIVDVLTQKTETQPIFKVEKEL